MRAGTVLAAGLGLVLAQSASAAADATGRWLTEGGKSHVEIVPCGDQLCGRIVWLREPLDDAGQPKRDRNNADPALQDRPVLGLPLLAGFVPGSEAGTWQGGTIYNPEDGKTYRCTLTLEDPRTLRVRGYVGLPIFGKTQVWSRVE